METVHALPVMVQPTFESQQRAGAHCNTDRRNHGGKHDSKERDAHERSLKVSRDVPMTDLIPSPRISYLLRLLCMFITKQYLANS